MLGLEIDHVAIAVPSLDEALALHASLSGAATTEPETLPEQGVRVAFVGSLELLEPLHPDTPVGRFISRRGPGFHHIAYRSADIPARGTRSIGSKPAAARRSSSAGMSAERYAM